MTIIVACDQNNAIGFKGLMPWHLKEDLLHFKAHTINNIVVMGRRTWQGLPIKPLPNRENIILSKDKNFVVPSCKVINSISQIQFIPTDGKTIFIIGGGQLYRQTIDMVDTILLTRIMHSFNSVDTFFPVIEKSIWSLVDSSEIKTDKETQLKYCFQTLKRK